MRKIAILWALGCWISTHALAQSDTTKLRMYTPQSQPTLQPQQNSNKSFENNSLYYQNNRLDQNRYNTPQPNGTYQAPGYSNPGQGTAPNTTTPGGTINNTPNSNINRTR